MLVLRATVRARNEENLFTGWYDADLTERGAGEALRGGRLLAEARLHPDVVHTSVLVRAIRTADLALDELDRLWIPVRRHWRLNERTTARPGPRQEGDRRPTRSRAGEALATQLRRPAAAGRPELTSTIRERPPVSGALARRPTRLGVFEGRRRANACLLVRRPSSPTSAPAIWSSSPPTATACGPWSSTWTASPTTRSPSSTSPPGCPRLRAGGRHAPRRAAPRRQPLPGGR